MLISRAAQSVLFPFDGDMDSRIRSVIPTAKRIVWRGKRWLAVKHGEEEAKVLRNMGYAVPTPMGVYFDWPGKFRPYAHQRVAAEFMAHHPRCFNASDLGTGKTSSAIWAAEWLMRQGVIRSVLVICPLSCVHSVWAEEIFRLTPDRSSAVLHGSRERRLELLGEGHPYSIINVDGIKTIDKELAKREFDLVIVDESSMFRNPKTERYGSLCRIVKPHSRLWLMSGTPCPNEPTDVWAQARLINPSSVPQYFGQFKRQVMEQVSQYRWVAKAGAYETAYEALKPSIRFTKEECLDLPGLVYVDRECELTKEQAKAYKTLHEEAVWCSTQGKVTAANAAVLMLKLMQVAAGVVKYGQEAEEKVVLDARPRLKLIQELIEENREKVIVFCPFKAQQRLIADYLGNEGINCWLVNGDTPEGIRRDVFKDIQDNPKGRKVLVAHPACMSHGVTLTKATMVIWAGPTFSGETYTQANARIYRAGQKNKCTVVHVYSTAVERKAYKMLQQKIKAQGLVLELFESEVKGT